MTFVCDLWVATEVRSHIDNDTHAKRSTVTGAAAALLSLLSLSKENFKGKLSGYVQTATADVS